MKRRTVKHFPLDFKRVNIIISVIANYGIRMQAKGFLGKTSLIVRETSALCAIQHKERQLATWMAAPNSNWQSFWPKLIQLLDGVCRGYSLRLVLYAIVFKCDIPRIRSFRRQSYIHLKLGFRHLVTCRAPEYSAVSASSRDIVVIGIDRVELRNFGIRVRSLAWPDVYKGKGIQYRGEDLKFKPGKQR